MQRKNVKISVIMPAYNVEEYIEKSIKSILSQRFVDFELIIVDDGSIDKTGEICNYYSKKDRRVTCIHQKNKGAALARNNALKIAKGKYVCFFDSDDYIENTMLSDLYKVATKQKSDLVISGFYIHTYYDDNKYITLNYVPDIDAETFSYTNKIEFRENAYRYFDKNMFYPPWNKLYNLDYIRKNKIKFPNTYRDDFPFVVSVIKNIEKVTFVKKQYYHFIRKREDSETQKYYKGLYNKRIEEHKMMLDLYKKWGLINDKNSFEMISRRYIDRVIECIVNLYNTKCILSNEEKRKEIKKYINNKFFDKSIDYAKPKKTYLKAMYLILKSKNISLCSLMGKVINNVKRNNIKIFSILKTYR